MSRHFSLIDANPPSPKGLPVLKTLMKLVHSYSALRRLRRDNQPLIVMVDSFSPVHIAMGLIARSLHLLFLVRLRGGMWREATDKWQFRPFPIKQLYGTYYYFCRGRTLTLADGIITVSHFLKNQIICDTDVDFGKVMPVHNPVDFAAFDEAQAGSFRKKLKIAEDQRIILTVTGFNYYKKYMAIGYYLRAILQVLEEDRSWYFVVAGGGYSFERARKKILGMAPEHIKNRILFTGYYKPIEEAFMDADVVLHLAFRETAPNVVLEAQAAGKPLIVNNFGGSPELLQNRYDEPRCVIKEIPELYESLKTLVSDDELRESMGRKNRQAVEKKFTYESIGDDFFKCINLLRGRTRRP